MNRNKKFAEKTLILNDTGNHLPTFKKCSFWSRKSFQKSEKMYKLLIIIIQICHGLIYLT